MKMDVSFSDGRCITGSQRLWVVHILYRAMEKAIDLGNDGASGDVDY